MPSYQFAPDAGAADRSSWSRLVKESGATGVLLSRVVNVSEQVKVSPGMYMGPPMGYGFGGFYGYYGGMWASSYYMPPTVYTSSTWPPTRGCSKPRTSRWSGRPRPPPRPAAAAHGSLFEQFAKLIVDAMAKDGFV